LGYAFNPVNEALRKQLEEGIIFSLPHPLELELAEKLVDVIPCAEMIRFGKNGSDATAGAVRLARYVTGREMVLCCGYHGWQDWYIGTTSRAYGIPRSVRRLTVPFAYNDFQGLSDLFQRYKDKIACVIMEPVGVEPPQTGFLEHVRDLCQAHGSLLIFDEIVTGFRFHLGGAQGYFGVTPDLACFGKGMGNGMPISCIAGRREIMKAFDRVFFSFTFGGEVLSLAAALTVIRFMETHRVIEKIWALGRALKEGTNRLISEHGLSEYMKCVGYPPRTVLKFVHPETDPMVMHTFWQQEVVQRGVLSHANHNLCYSHGARDVEETLGVYEEVLDRMKGPLNRGELAALLKGPVLEPVFRRH